MERLFIVKGPELSISFSFHYIYMTNRNPDWIPEGPNGVNGVYTWYHREYDLRFVVVAHSIESRKRYSYAILFLKKGMPMTSCIHRIEADKFEKSINQQLAT